MKRLLVASAIIVAAYCLPSCRSSWTCSCTTTVDSNGKSEQSTRTSTIPGPEQQARSICDTGTSSYTSTAYTTSTLCTLQ